MRSDNADASTSLPSASSASTSRGSNINDHTTKRDPRDCHDESDRSDSGATTAHTPSHSSASSSTETASTTAPSSPHSTSPTVINGFERVILDNDHDNDNDDDDNNATIGRSQHRQQQQQEHPQQPSTPTSYSEQLSRISEEASSSSRRVSIAATCHGSAESPLHGDDDDDTIARPDNNNDPGGNHAAMDEASTGTPDTQVTRRDRGLDSRQSSMMKLQLPREDLNGNHVQTNRMAISVDEESQDTMQSCDARVNRTMRDLRRKALDRCPPGSPVSARRSISGVSIHAMHQLSQKPSAHQSRFRRSFYWLAHHNRRLGLRHFVMLVIVSVYTLLGALMFYYLEHAAEHTRALETISQLEGVLSKAALTVAGVARNDSLFGHIANIQSHLRDIYIEMLELEGRYQYSAYAKLNDPDRNYKWSFGSSFFFCNNIYTTTGYGTIACDTVAGQIFTMIYGLLFIPLTSVVLRDLGQWTLVHLTKLYGRVLVKARKLYGQQCDPEETITLPIKFCLSLMALYLILSSVIVFNYDAMSGPPGTGLNFFHCFYFSFISLSTVGLGDVMPNNVPFSPLIVIIFFFGLPVMKVVNRVTYVAVENGVFGTLTVLENRLKAVGGGPGVRDMETGVAGPVSFPHSRAMSMAGGGGAIDDLERDEDAEEATRFLNNFTVRSIATFMRSRADVYGGDFGRVAIKKEDLQ